MSDSAYAKPSPKGTTLVRKLMAVAVLLSGCMAWRDGSAEAAGNPSACVPQGVWMEPADKAAGDAIAVPELFRRASATPVVLLGERHDSAEHHRWQLHTLAGLHAHRPELVIGMEMFPRRVQPALDRWSAGRTTEEEFLSESDWRTVWGYDSALYMPILQFARMHRIPVVALNVDRALTARVGREGWNNIPPSGREGVGDPAPAPSAYTEKLAEIYSAHGRQPGTGDVREDPSFRRFQEAQLLWDRAMAEAIADAHRRTGATVVGIVGAGHLEGRHGIPHQLSDLGIGNSMVLLPWSAGIPCSELEAGLADAVFGVSDDQEEQGSWRPRLGVSLAPQEEGLRIESVVGNSVAETAGLRAGDIILAAAGTKTSEVGKFIDIVNRQAPGTWLPLSVRRDGATREIVAKFPVS
ncbi:ChaN family lipoprotein [Skermanella sp. TT6]|uniref:ChaN family lipoprotein n=1 Tax=Skermanella cutis TaxID=2775420 RepID=A0ABX7AZ03_9PROT|nr:ChaN family lipoprotein [Skermanella sp. TT6]